MEKLNIQEELENPLRSSATKALQCNVESTLAMKMSICNMEKLNFHSAVMLGMIFEKCK